MHERKGFTLVELLVVISIIALLMSILMPALSKARQQAYTVVCLSNVKQWGNMFLMYSNDNNGNFSSDHATTDDSGSWPEELGGYYGGNGKMRLCPAAKKGNQDPQTERDYLGKTFKAACWGSPYWGWNEKWIDHGDWYSYGKNWYAANPTSNAPDLIWGCLPKEDFWRSPDKVKHAHNVPLFGDCIWLLAFPDDDNPVVSGKLITPPPYEDVFGNWGIETFCLNRHGNGTTNLVFMDWSARRVGLKELWTLKWHRNFNTSNMYTIAGGATRSQWEIWASWMKNFKDY